MYKRLANFGHRFLLVKFSTSSTFLVILDFLTGATGIAQGVVSTCQVINN